MKKLILSFAVIMITAASFSQVKVRPGIRTGINASTITDLNNSSRKIGVNGAIFVNLRLGGFYELQPEFTYSNQGWSQDFPNVEPYNDPVYQNNNDGDVNVHYIGMAITNKFYFVPNLGLHFIIGPSVEVNISDNLYYDDLTPIDFALFGGLGYEFPIGLGIEARYKQGLIDVRDGYYDYYFDDNNNDYYNGSNKLNSVFQFNVYYKFGW
ncbi:porin family protein [Hanstruepera flava]|uniref:porin family protein n=1 Tax=Hanstruepera flava TaxID=2930218 RepID=UPI002027825F|nr:porin family protein [Hanstruepera flava]